MLKYIVTYIIIKSVMIGCPVPQPHVDEFGRSYWPMRQTAEICYRTDTAKMEKIFMVRKDAIDFIERGTTYLNQFDAPGGSLSNFKLDSAKVKKL